MSSECCRNTLILCDQLFLIINYFARYVGTVGEKSQLQGKKMIKDLTKKMFLLESSDGASSAGGSAVVFYGDDDHVDDTF